MLASEILHQSGFDIKPNDVKSGLKNVVKLTGLRGRWETIFKKPLAIADIAHNEAGINEVIRHVKTIPHKKLHVVFGTVNDKDTGKILSLLPKKATYYFCKADIPRALDQYILSGMAGKYGLNGKTFGTVRQALSTAKARASSKDLILITGSAFVVAEVI